MSPTNISINKENVITLHRACFISISMEGAPKNLPFDTSDTDEPSGNMPNVYHVKTDRFYYSFILQLPPNSQIFSQSKSTHFFIQRNHPHRISKYMF